MLCCMIYVYSAKRCKGIFVNADRCSTGGSGTDSMACPTTGDPDSDEDVTCSAVAEDGPCLVGGKRPCIQAINRNTVPLLFWGPTAWQQCLHSPDICWCPTGVSGFFGLHAKG